MQATYAANPIPQIPAAQFRVRGGLTYPGVNGQSNLLWNYNKKNFMPRISFAYSITPRPVFRGGYGIYFEPIGVPNQDVIQTGFSQTTNAESDSRQRPALHRDPGQPVPERLPSAARAPPAD